MSETTGKWRAIGLWFVAAYHALLVGGSFYRLWQGIQAGSDIGIRRGLIMIAVYGMCFLAAALAIFLSRKAAEGTRVTSLRLTSRANWPRW